MKLSFCFKSFNDTVFIQNTARGYGGAVYLNANDNLIIYNSTFKYGNANYASAIYCNGTDKNIYSCNFINNTARYWGVIDWVGNYGMIYGSNFTNNTAASNAAITIHGNNGNVSHCSFDSNKALTGAAGSIMVDGINTTIDNCSFVNNWACLNGGSIVSQKDNTYIYDSTFKSNVASNGGAIYFEETNLIVYNTTFESNHVDVHGGAIACDNSNFKNSIISNCTFKSNYGVDPIGCGGAIYYSAGDDDLTVSDSTFESNSQLGIMLPGNPDEPLYNSAGAIYFVGNMLKIDNCNFTSNCATANYVAECYTSVGAIDAWGKCNISNST